ncbi:MAG TPA: hypothetical protein DCW31_07470, partial [Lactobacillus sp.]|nr:hypothetical protein [Lactobacillus sp.]
ALRQGHSVVAISRHDHRVDSRSQVEWGSVDYNSIEGIASVLSDSDAAVISLGDFDVVTPTEKITQAMNQAGVRRLEILTGFGTSPTSRKQLGLGMRLIMTAMRPMLRTKEKQDQIVRNSELNFTIVQPPTLTDGSATRTYRYGDYKGKTITGHISRADLSEFMVTNLTQNRYAQSSVYIQE